MNQNIHTIYFSANGNTQKIVNEMAINLSTHIIEHNLTLPKNREINLTFNLEDVVIFGVPVYGGRIPQFLMPTLNNIKGQQTKAIFTITYGNRDYEDALLELKEIGERNGFIGIAAAAFIGEHSATEELATKRPNLEDLSMASHFAKQLIQHLNQTPPRGTLTVPGNNPYIIKQLAMPSIVPTTTNLCMNCGICAKNCPMEAIDFKDVKVVDSTKCIKCRRCVKKCPKKAKAIVHPAYHNLQHMLINNFARVNRQPEFFYQSE